MTTQKTNYHFADKLWDLWCIVSLVGIWPRFIEPNMLITKRLEIPIQNLSPALANLRIFVFSDLHINSKMPQRHLVRLINKIKETDPDLILFTGDFICNSTLDDKERLLNFLNAIPVARYGNFAIPGNHDYTKYLTINDDGDYDVLANNNAGSMISKGFRRLFCSPPISGKVTARARATPLHQDLAALIAQSPFRLLHNESIPLNINGATLNICGLGEYMGGQTLPAEAYKNYNCDAHGIILLHNPDGIPLLNDFPGDVILCGHTHGGQINLPWIWQRLALMEHPRYKRGLIKENGRHIYITRGVGALMTFRWFSLPEILIVTLKSQPQK